MTGHQTTGGITAVLVVLAVVLSHAQVWPSRVCSTCDGVGETGPKDSTARRVCWRCKGTRRTRRWLNHIPGIVALLVDIAAIAAVLTLRALAR
jgi:hypothetical protein